MLTLATYVGQAVAAPASFQGTFELFQSLTFYVVNDSGGAFAVKISVRDERIAEMDRPVLVRVFDVDERLVARHDFPGELRADKDSWNQIAVDVPASTAGAGGVYSIVITGFGGALQFATEPSMPFGVFGAPQLIANDRMFEETFIYIPPGLDVLQIKHDGGVESLSLTDESGVARVTLNASQTSASASVTDKAGQVWRLSVSTPRRAAIDFSGLPIILCPDPDTARAIHASVDVLDDGTICFHKFQGRIHGVLARYRAMDGRAFDVPVPPLATLARQWEAQPQRNQLLLGTSGVYSGLPATLREQNLDPSSPWFGCIHSWRDPAGRARAENPWASLNRLGLPRVADTVGVLGAVYSVDEPINPLYHNEALRNRIIIASLQELMLLREYELPNAVITDYFGGERSMNFAPMTQSFPLVIRDCPDDVREVWTEGLRRCADRQVISQVGTTTNQWTFIPVGLQDFYDGTAEQWYADMIARHVRWMLTRNQWSTGLAEAGYFDESQGPDATYIGISLHNLAWLWERTHDEALLKALDQCLTFMNHTVAPEPNGTWMGASSFCHRTPGDWTHPQWGAGLGMLVDQLPSAAAHDGRTWPVEVSMRSLEGRRRIEAGLADRLQYLPINAMNDERIGAVAIASGPGIQFRAWQFHSESPMQGSLPALESNRFTHRFGTEMLAARRPGYYSFAYAGVPMGTWQESRRPADAHQQHPRNGGGLCMFWSPQFGTSILGKNWSAYSAQTIIAERADGGADWEDYWSVHAELDEQAGMAKVNGHVRNQPLAFERDLRFRDDGAFMSLTLRADQAVTLRAMWECFPFPLDKPGSLRAVPVDAQGRPIQNEPAQAVVFRNQSDDVHVLVFNSPRQCEVGVERSTDVYGKPREHGRVLAALPANWTMGMQSRARWMLMAAPSGAVPAAIARAVKVMQNE